MSGAAGEAVPSPPIRAGGKTSCDLCGLRLPRTPYRIVARGEQYEFCCGGCRQVFQLLSDSGMIEGDFRQSELYKTSLKLGIIGNPEEAPAAAPLSATDLQGTKELVLHVDGMWCSSCSWLIEKVVGNEKGVVQTRVLYASDTAKIAYRPEEISPEEIAARIAALGYATSDRDSDAGARAPERRSLLLRMGIALFLLNNIMFFSYTLYIGYFQELASEMKHLVPIILLVMTTPSVFWCGMPVHRKAWASARNGAPTMELLFSIGIFASYFYSIHALMTGGENFYFDTSAALVALLLVGKFIEISAKNKVSESIHRLYQMLPKKVRLRAPEGERLVGIEKLQIGDLFIVKSGEKIPADGEIVEGTATVDESLLSGESKPIEKHPGNAVAASSMNVNGHLIVRATSVGRETVLANIIGLVEKALMTKSPLEQTVDKIARVFIPFVLVFAAATGAVVALLGGGTEAALLRSITVLVIACPCVLGMATPLALAAGIGNATKQGILVRDGEALQRVAAITDAVLDKTGTLTEGKFALLETRFPGIDEEQALRFLGTLEKTSSHPIALAIVQACSARGLVPGEASGVLMAGGKGLSGIVEGKRVVAGNETFLRAAGFILNESSVDFANRERELGRTIVVVGIEGMTAAGVCVLGDRLKPGAAAMIQRLLSIGVRVELLSGDSSATTAAVAKEAGIASYIGDALPSDKIARIAAMQAEGKRVAMIGDGVNDAPALAQADVGIAMGSGTQMAVESAGVTLMRDDLSLVPESVLVSRRTVRTVKQNLVWAFLYNSLGLVLAAAGVLNPLIAASAMLVSSLSVVLNSMRLREKEGRAWQMALEILVPWREP